MQWYGLLTSLHLSPCHSFLFTASTSSTRQTRRPSPRRTHTSPAFNDSSRSATPSQGTQFPSTTPLQSRSPPPGRGSPCAHQAYSAHRRYPIPSLPARVGLQTVRATLHLYLMPARPALLLLAALCFLLTTKLSEPLFRGVVGALQALARAAGHLALRTPRDGFLAALANATFPPRVVVLEEPPLAPRSAVSPRGSRYASQAAVGAAEAALN